MHRASFRLGLTFIKMLVIFLLAGILFALLLPALVAAREASHRTLCRDNLKRLGLAMHNYHDAHRVFPPGIVSAPGGTYTANENVGRNQGSSASALTLILPFMDERPLYAAYNRSLGCADGENSTATATIV